jgi:mRNA interferase MazF
MPDVRQGQIYVTNAGMPRRSEIGGRRPFVILQNDPANESGLTTALAAPLTRNLRRGRHLGNVTLEAGEGGIRDRSVVNVSQARAVDKRFLDDLVGQLSERRVREIIAGLNMLLTPRG